MDSTFQLPSPVRCSLCGEGSTDPTFTSWHPLQCRVLLAAAQVQQESPPETVFTPTLAEANAAMNQVLDDPIILKVLPAPDLPVADQSTQAQTLA